MLTKNLWNVPNTITFFRFPLTGITWYYAILGQRRMVGYLLIAALLTDFFDGFFARLLKQETEFGAHFDGIADAFLDFSMVAWIAMFLPEIFKMPIILTSVAALTVTYIYGAIKYRGMPAFHLYSNKAMMTIGGTFVVHSFLFGTNIIFCLHHCNKLNTDVD